MRVESIITSQERKLLEKAGEEGDERKFWEEIERERRIREERRRREKEEHLRKEAKRLKEKEQRVEENEQREWEEILAMAGGNENLAKLILQLRKGAKLNIKHFDTGSVREVSQRAAKR